MKKVLFAIAFFIAGAAAMAQAPGNCTAAIGSPANGSSHYINISWAAAGGATAYQLQDSTPGGTWADIYNGTALTYAHNTGNIGNLPYFYRVRATVSGTPSAWTNCTQFPLYSACDNPALPLLSNAGAYNLSLSIQPESPDTNPAYTVYSIYCTTTGQYVQANGTLGTTELFQTKAGWGTVNVNGLTASTNYCFYVKAKNMDGDVRVANGSGILAAQPFNSNVLVTGSTASTSVWFAPNSHTPFAWNASGGCTGGMISYSGSFTNYWGNFVRTPQQNCTGNSTVALNFDISHSYNAAHIVANPSSSDAIRCYMYIDNGYKHASSIKINGVEVGSYSAANGMYLKFDTTRTCVNVTVTFDLTTSSNLSNVLFYIEAGNPYNDSKVYSVVLDNISLLQGTASACLSTIACSTATIQNNPANQATCEGYNATFTVTTTGAVAAYRWQESSNGGSNWTNLNNGGIYSNVTTGTLNLNGVTAGMSGYQYRCAVTGSCSGNPTSNAGTLTVNSLPGNAGTVTGNNNVCAGQNGVSYSILSVPGASGYTWTLPAGASIATGANSASITVNYSAGAQSGSVMVSPTSGCGSGGGSLPLQVTVNTTPSMPGAIGGSTSSCPGGQLTYSVAQVSGATAYTWALPNGWTGTSVSNSITATAGANGGTISVTANNSCGNSNAQTLTVTSGGAPATPAAINGPVEVCAGTAVTYSVNAVAGATGYTWGLPAGWSGSSTAESITVTTGGNGGTIQITANSACGNSTPQTLNVTTVAAVPAMPGIITGADTVCANATSTYSVAAVQGATSYTWVLPNGWGGSSAGNTINATANANGGLVTITADNICGSSLQQTAAIVVQGALPQLSAIAGADSICQGTQSVYTVSQVAGADFYTWALPNGWSGTSATNTINATAGATGGTITVTAGNSCGNSNTQSITVSALPALAAPGAISGPDSVCAGASNWFTIAAVPGAESYVWTLPNGWTGTSTTSSINVAAGNTPGTITVAAVNACGTSTVTGKTVAVGICTGIQGLQAASVQLYPNPFKNQVSIRISQSFKGRVLVYDNMGRQAGQAMLTTGLNTVNVENLAAGFYTFSIISDIGTVNTYKLFKEE